MSNYSFKDIVDLDKNLIEGECINGSVNERKCYGHWPKFPCYNKQTLSCESTNGTILVDPISDYIYVFSEAILNLGKILGNTLEKLPEEEKKKQEEKLIRYFYDSIPYIPILPTLLGKLNTLAGVNDLDNEINRNKVVNVMKKPFEGGGHNYNYITNPINGSKLNIKSNEGINILNKYINYSNL